ncbi:MAG: gliding motility-associated C-terminal domain-containing protein [Flavobacteriales bacterium]|nr:gliding motility-associated C-terminal domain-containing protein [Flavobacteriales bacterium]
MKQALLFVLGVLFTGHLFAQTGTEFWLAPPEVTSSHGDSPIFINVTTLDQPAVVTISQPANAGFNGGSPIVLNLAANSAQRYNLTSLKNELETRPTNAVLNTGLRISATSNITCYYEPSYTNNPDIAALKGANGLGTEFYIPLHKHAPFFNHGYGAPNKAYASFDIVATEANTTVLIYSPVPVDGQPALSPFTVTLNQGQTYSCAWTGASHTDPTTHPSGAVVLSDKPVAISIKDDSNHNPSGGCYDLMLDQIVPVNILGTDYVAVKGALYNTGDESLFVMAVQNNTQIYIDGNPAPVATLFAGQYYRHDMDYLAGAADNATYVSGSKPLYAIHVTGFGCEQGMAILPPLNCAGSTQLSFTRSTSEAFFLNLLVRNGSQNNFVVTGPGTATIPGSAFQVVPGTGGEWMAARIQYNATQVPVNQAFIVSNTTDVFSLAIINGGAGSGCRYGFFSEFSGRIDVSAGSDQTLCAGDSVLLTGAVSGGSTTGIWTTTGSGTFAPSATALSATYHPSIGDLAIGSVTLTLTSTGPCTPEDDAMVVTFSPKPIPDAGPDQSVCRNNSVVQLAGSVLNAVGGVWTGGAGAFLPSNSNLNATYTPTAAELTAGQIWIKLTSTGNGVCAAIADSMLVTFTLSPTANAGADQSRCANNAVTQLNGSFTVATGGVWSGGAGSFDPSTTNMSAQYTPTAAEISSGSVTLTMTTTGNGNCVAVNDQALISFTAAPVVNAGAAVSVCANNALVTLSGSVTGATGGAWSGGAGTYNPNNTTLAATYTPTAAEVAAGTLTLTLSSTGNGNCIPVTSDKVITFTAAPTVNAGPAGTVCANNSAITLAGSFTGATGAVWSGGTGTYAPNNTTMNAVYTPSAAERTAGTVTLTLTTVGNGNCNAVSSNVTYAITPAPTANAGADQSLCANNAVATLNGSFTVATGGVWSGGAGSFDPSTTNMGAQYTPTAGEIASGSVTLTLTTTGNGGCVAVTDQVLLSFTSAPVVSAGAAVSVCANNVQVALNGSVTGATGGAWSGGTGSFNPNATTLNATYTPSAAEIAAGTVTLTLTSTGNANCNAVSSSKVITITPAPTVDAGPNATVCANNSAITLEGSITVATGATWSGGTGVYAPNNTTLNATYTPSAAERAAGTVTLTLTTVGNGNCNAVSDQVTFTITPAPTANAGADRTVCANNAVVTLNGSFTVATGGVWSGGAGSFDPSTTNMGAQYTPTAGEISSGSVTLTMTTTGNGGCVAVADQMTIAFTAAPVVNAGAAVSLCANNAQVSLSGSVTGATGGIWSGGTGTFNPDNTTLTATYTPTAAEIAAGTLTLTLTSTGNGTCNPVTNNKVISFTPAPIVNAGADGSVCRNNADITLNGSVIGATGGIWSGGTGSYNPNNTTLNAVYTPSAAERAAGTVTLTLTSAGNGNCNAVNDAVTYTITPSPTANAGADQVLCTNNPVASLGGSVTVATGGIWSGGAGTFAPSTTNLNATYTPTDAEIASGLVTLTLTTTGNGTCIAVNDQVQLSFTPSPTANAGADLSLCRNNASFALGGSVTIATGGIWSGGSGSYTPNNTTLNATYTPTPAELAAGTLTLTLTTTGNSNCNAVADSRVITFTPSPTVNAGANGSVCANNSAITLNGAFTGSTGAAWSGGAGTYNPNNTTLNAVYTPTAAERTAGTVTLTLTTTGNGNCNAVSDNVTFSITPAPTANAGVDRTVCGNNAAVALAGSFTGATGGVWSGGAGSFDPSTTNMGAIYTPSAAEVASGSVTLTVTTTGNGTCNAVADQMTITYTAAPVVNAGAAVSLCANNAQVSLSGSVSGATSGVWSGGTGTYNPNNTTLTATYTPTAAEIAGGTLTLTLTSTGNGTCNPVQSSKVITFTPSPIVNAGPDGSVCNNNSIISLNGSVTGATGAIWSGGAGVFTPNNTTLTATYTPTAAERAAGTVTLTLTSAGNGNCNAVSDAVTYTITPAPTANAGADQTLCSNNAIATLGGSFTVATGGIWSGGNGSFSPSTTNMNATYTPTAAEIANGNVTLTLTTTGNGTCVAVTDQVQINYTPSPTANAGPDLSLCRNNAAVPMGGSVTVATGGIWSGGAGSFTPNNTTLNATYTPTPAELAAGTLTLTLTTTGNGNCTAVSDSRVITFTPSPTVDAGANATVCANNSAITLNGSFTGSTGAIWSGGTGTYNPNSSTMNAVYTPSAAERTAGTVTLTLTTAGNGNCNAVSDNVTFTITPSPTANAGTDRTVCANNAAVALNGSFTVATGGVWSGGAGTFDPSTTNMGAIYTPSAAEIANGFATLTLTTTGNGTCIAVADQMTISITDAPVVNAGAAIALCANNSLVSLNGSVSGATGGAWSGGSGTYNPNNTTLNATYTPSAAELAAGTVTLTLTSTGNGLCNPVSSSRTISFTPAPTANAGPDASVCSNNANITLNGAFTVATGAIWSGGSGTYNPNNATMNAVYTPSAAERAAGTVTLTLTTVGNGSCNAVSDAVTFTITPTPTANAGADRTVCANNGAVTLAGSFTVATGGVWSGGNGTFDPSTTNMGAIYTPTAAEIANGSVTLTLTTTGNGNCIAVADQMTINFTPAPVVNAGAAVSLCANNAQVSLNGSVSGATGGVWSGGTGTYSPNNTNLNATYTPTAAEIAGGTLTLTLTSTGNGTCNPVQSSRVITFTPAPIVNAGPDGSVCNNASIISLGGSVIGATGAIWSGGAGTYTPNNTTLNATYSPSAAERTAGTVTLTLTSAGNGNCTAVSDQVTYSITPAPTANAGADQALCSNNAIATLGGSVTVATGGIWSGGAGTFAPSTANMNATYTPTAVEIANGNVTLTLTTTGNGTCVAVTDQMQINYTPSPTANAGPDLSLCRNNASFALGGSVTVATGGIWSGGAGSFTPNNTTLNATYTPTPTELAAGTLTLTLTTTGNGNCIAVADSRVITFTPSPTVDAGLNGSVCANNSAILLNGSFTGSTGVSWSGGAGTYNPNNTTINAVYTPSAAERTAGTVTLTLTTTGNGNCNAVSDAVTFIITPTPTANAGADRTVCANNAAVTLAGSFTVATGGVWSGGNGTFDPSTTNMGAIYTPTATEIANGSVTLTLTTTGNGNCIAVADQMTINFTPAPVVNAGAAISLCANNAQVSLNGSVSGATGGVWSGGTGTYSPNNSTLNANYTPTSAEIAGGTLTLTLTSTGNGTCNPVQSSRLITFTPAPSVDAGPNGTVCANNSAITLAGTQSGATGAVWSGGTGTYSPNNATLTAVYTPSAAERTAGTVTLTLTTVGNGNCNAVSDQVTYSITPAPTANAGADQSLCANNASTTLSGSVTVATGGIWSGGAGSFSPSTTNLNATYTPTATEIASGSVTITLTTTGVGGCVAVADQMTVTFTPAPIANAGAPVSICVNNPQVTMTGSVTGATGGAWSGGLGSFTPNNTTLNATYTPTPAELAAGTLTLTLTTTGNGNCNAVQSSRVITFTPAPIVDAGANGTVCANNSVITLNGSFSGATGAIWSGGAGTFSPNSTTLNATYTPTAAERAAGTVTLTLTSAGNGNCNAVSDQVTFSITPAPTANAGADIVLCSNNATATLNGGFTVATGGIWSGGAGTYSPSSTNMNASYTPTAGEISSGSVTLTLTTTGNNNCVAVSDQVLLSFTPSPTVDAGADVSLCRNNAAVVLNGAVGVATGGIWSGGAGSFTPNNTTLNATYTPTPAELSAGTLTLTLTTTGNGTCNSVSDSKVITFTPAPTVDAGANATVCANNSAITLAGTVVGAGGATWSGGTGTYNPNNQTLNATYTPSAVERAAGTVTLTLTTSGNGNCNPVSDQVTYSITPAPTANAGADRVLCANNASTGLSGAFSIATGGIWSGGSGTFDPSTTNMSAIYTPTAAEITAGSVLLTLTTTGNGLCNAVTDQVLLTFTDPPSANAGPDATRCANNAAVALGGSVIVATGGTWTGGTGTFTPNATTLNATYNPGAGDLAAGQVTLTLTTTGNGNCTPATDTKIITYTPAPIVNAGANGAVCANAATIALNGTVTGAVGGVWSGGAGSFSPNNITLNATYTPTAAEITAGTVTLILTSAGNGQCNAVSSDVTYTITLAPTVNAGVDQSVCGNNAIATLSAAVTVASGVQWSGGSGFFNPGSTAQNITYSPSPIEVANGSVTLIATTTGNGNCAAVSDAVTITYTQAPIANAGPDQTVSSNNANTTLVGSFSISTGAVWSGGSGTYNPNNTTMNAVYTPTAQEIAAGSVTLTLITTGNGSCSPATDQMTIFFGAAPTANAGPDQTVCANNANVQLNGAITIATGGIWSGGTGTYNPNNSALNAIYTPSAAERAAGTVTLTLTSVGNGNSNPVSDQIVITITPAPIANAGANIAICANQATAQLAGVVNNATGGIWSGGSGTFNPSNTNLNATYTPTLGEIAAGTLTLTLSSTGNGLCNGVSDQVLITIAPAPVVNASVDQTVCANNANVQMAGSVSNAGGGIWSGGTGTFSPSINTLNAVYTPSTSELANGSVTLTLSSTGNGSCVSVSDQMTIFFSQSPVVLAGLDRTVCANDPTVILNGSVTIASGGVWSGGGGTFTPNANTLNASYYPSPAEVALGTATLTLTSTGNGLCNAVNDQMVITIIASPSANAGNDIFVCSNNAQVQLGGSVSGAGGGQWSGGAGTFTPSIASLNAIYTPTAAEIAAGTLTLTLTTIGNGNCVPVSDQVLITFTASPTANAGVDGVRCANNAGIQLNGIVTVANGGTWSGAGGTFTPNANALNAVYTPSAGELAAGQVTLTLTTTGNNGCTAVSDDVSFTFTPAPTANAGVDAAACANNASVVLNGAITVATGAIWSGGAGTFSPNNSTLNATYVPSASEIVAGTVTLTLTTVGNGTCNPVNDQMVITINPSPIVNAGTPLTSCANNAAVALSGAVQNATGGFWSGAGIFTPSATNLSATYAPSNAEIAAGTATITLTSTGNDLCNAVSSQVVLTITAAPIVEAGANQVLCANNAVAQLGGQVTNATGGAWSGGVGTFAPNASTLNAAYTPSAAEVASGSLWLFLTSTGNGGCLSSRDSVQMQYTPAPTVNAGLDLHICANTTQINLNGAVTIATGGIWSGGNGAFTPANTALNAAYSPTAAEIASGQFTLVLSTTGNGNCMVVRDSLLVIVDPVPVVNAGPDQQICANNSNVQLNGFVGNAPGGVWSGGAGTFFPSNTMLATQYMPTTTEIASGSLTLTLTSTGTVYCNAVTDQMTIVFTGAPIVDAGSDLQICANNSAVQLTGNVTNASGGTWTGGSGSFAPNSNVLSPVYTPTAGELTAGTLSLYLTSTGNSNCIAVRDTVVVTFTPAPTANAGSGLEVCMNSPLVTLNGSITVATDAQWTGGLGTFTPNAQTLNAQYAPTPFELQSGSLQLTLTTTGNGNCIAVADQMTITVTPSPVVDAGADVITCSNQLQVPLNGTVQGGATAGLWSSSGTGIFSPSATTLTATYIASSLDSLSGTVDITLTSTSNGLCNAVSDVMTVTILPNAIANAGVDQTVCSTTTTVQLNGTITGNATQGQWTTTGAGSFTPDANAANAVYQLAPGDQGSLTFTWSVNSCDNAMDQMVVTITPESVADAGVDQVTCFGNLNVVINGSVSGASSTGTWSTLGSGTFTNPNTALSNVYQASANDQLATGVDLILTATNTGVCQASADTVHIAIQPAGTVNAGFDVTACANNAATQLNGTLTGDATQVQWTTSGTGSFFPNANVLTPTYIPSAIDTAIGSLTLTLSAPGTCNNATDDLLLTLSPAPYVNAGPDQTYCDQVTQFNLSGVISGITNSGQWTTTGTGMIANAVSLNTTYTASAADVANGSISFTLTSQNNANCNAVSDVMTIYLTSGIIVSAGPDQTVCVASDHANMQATVQNGSPSGTWSATGSGTFSPSADVLNAQYFFSAADVTNGSVVLTFMATNTGTCPTTQDQMVLTFGNSSFAYAGADQTLCANSPIAQLAGNFSGGAQGIQWSSNGSGFFSNNTDPNATYTLSAADIAAGTVQLSLTTITNGSCTPSTDVMVLSVNALPNITAGADIIACTSAPVQITANVANAGGGMWTTSGTGTFFDPNALATLYTPSAADSLAGSVTLTVTTMGVVPCSAVSDQLVISFGGGLDAEAGMDVIACSTDPNIALNGVVAGTTTGTWSTSGTGSFTPSASALNATYIPGAADYAIGNINLILSTTNNQGCPAGRDTLVVSYHVPPTVNGGADVLLCDGIEDVQLGGTAQNQGSVQWITMGTGGFSPDAAALNAVYTPTANDSIAGGVYLVITAFGTGTCGNASDSVFIDIGPTRIANAGADQTVCADMDPIALGGSITGVSGGVWSTNGTGTFLPDATTLGATYVPSMTDMAFSELRFILTTTGNMGCPADADSMLVNLQARPTVNAGSDLSTCDASVAVDVAGSFTGATGVLWTTNGSGVFLPSNTSANASYQPGNTDEQLGTVRMILTTTGNGVCAAAGDTVMLSFVNPLEADFTWSNACAGSQMVFTSTSTTTGAPIIGWNWSFGNGTSGTGPQTTTSFDTQGQYLATLTVFAQNGCSSTITHTIDVLNAPVAGFTIAGDPFTDTPIEFTDNSFGATNWHYDFGDGTGAIVAEPTHEYTESGQFIIIQTVTNPAGCSDRDSLLVSIEVKDILPPKLPNAFSPNGDGVNDVFFVRGGPFETMHFRVYNGWGELLFETEDPEFGWDGTHDGKPEINGVYVYSVIATTTDGILHDRSGKISLIR